MARPVASRNLEVAAVSDVRDYWTLLKPNVMSLVVFSAAVGLALAPVAVHPVLALVAVLAVGTAAGAAAAINNSYDVDIDRLMTRTRRRPTAVGRIPAAEALAFGIALAIGSIVVMGLALNWLAASLLAFTIAFYVVVYTLWLKRRTPQNIVIGGAAGAIPPVIGWAAVTGEISLFPILLFLIIFMWTPPHFWALSLYRATDYERAGVPMLPVVAGAESTRRHVLAYTLLLVPVTLLPYLIGYAGWFYGLASLGLNAGFVGLALQLHQDRTQRTATRTFRFSLLYLFGLFAALVADRALLGGSG
ncbi:MAG: heme o synthase [Geminicoccaceae bacterium]|nr:heme o synthase [Geminicoccaceae bacterium]